MFQNLDREQGQGIYYEFIENLLENKDLVIKYSIFEKQWIDNNKEIEENYY